MNCLFLFSVLELHLRWKGLRKKVTRRVNNLLNLMENKGMSAEDPDYLRLLQNKQRDLRKVKYQQEQLNEHMEEEVNS